MASLAVELAALRAQLSKAEPKSRSAAPKGENSRPSPGANKPLEVKEAGSASGKYLAKQAGIGKAALRAPVAAATVDLTKLALGIRGMAQIQGLLMRAQIQGRMLFRGIDSQPAVRAVANFLRAFDASSVAGRATAGILSRSFNSIFSLLEKAAPSVTTFFQGMVLGALYAEQSYLRLRIALFPLTSALGDLAEEAGNWIERTTGLPPLAWAGAAALGAMGLAAAGSAAPFLAAAAAIGALIVQIDRYNERQKKKQNNAADQGRVDAERRKDAKIADEGRLDAERRKDWGGDNTSADYARAEAERRKDGAVPTRSPAPAQPSAAPTGAANGKALADGVAQGLDAGGAQVDAAAGKLIRRADGAMRKAGDIHSPSGLARDTAAEIPAGAVQGIQGGAANVQRAAGAMMPNLAAPRASGTANGAAPMLGPIHVTIVHQHAAGAPRDRAQEDASEAGTWKAMRAVANILGVSVTGATA